MLDMLLDASLFPLSDPSGRAKDGLFHLDEISGVLTTQSNTFDRDIATGGTEYYDIVVRAADKGYPSRFVTITVRVTLTDVNDNEPKFPTLLTYVSNVITEKDVAGSFKYMKTNIQIYLMLNDIEA